MSILSNSLTIRRWQTTAAIATGIAIVGLAGGYFTFQAVGAQDSVTRWDRAFDEAEYLPGTLDPAAAEQITTFTEFPLLWFGEEFQGYQLVNARRTNSEHEDSVRMIYGDCVSDYSGESPSCVPPFEVIVWRPGSTGGPDSMEPSAVGELQEVRGVPARVAAGGLILWTGGIMVTVHGNADQREAAVKALQLANGSVVGLDDIGPGESLEPLGR